MRANVHLDDEAYGFASAYAGARGISLGAAMSELIRRADQLANPGTYPGTSQGADQAPQSTRLATNRLGLLVKAKTGQRVTAEMVRRLSEDDLD